MSFRQLMITSSAHLCVNESKICVKRGEFENHVPFEDVGVVIIDGTDITMSNSFVAMCGKHGVTVLSCGDNHMPSSITYPINEHYRPLQVIEYQIELPDEQKQELAELLLKQKVNNQASVIQYTTEDEHALLLLEQYEGEIAGDDFINREGTAAKVFFNSLYGKEYTRFEDNLINKMQNYGYGVLRSSIARAINSLGLCSYLGVNHKGKTNPLNLVYDLIEPFRPLVDYYIFQNFDPNEVDLKTQIRKELVNLLNAEVSVNSKTVKVQYAIELLAKSYLRSIEYGEIALDLPRIKEVNFNKLNEPV